MSKEELNGNEEPVGDDQMWVFLYSCLFPTHLDVC